VVMTLVLLVDAKGRGGSASMLFERRGGAEAAGSALFDMAEQEEAPSTLDAI